jgi:HSP20 family protein
MEGEVSIMAMSFDPFSELDRLTGNLLQFRTGSRFMPVDLFRDGDRYLLTADLPGVDPGSIDVDVDGQLLTIRADRTSGEHVGVKWLARERPFGSYVRQFSLGEGVDSARISASYDNGVLSVMIPISEKAKPRKIEIESGRKRSEQHPELAV